MRRTMMSIAMLAVLLGAAGASADPPAVRCKGRMATIVGDDGADDLLGTAGDDVIAARGGDDRVRSLGGNDVVCGGAGRDLLVGGRGRDLIFGGTGDDRLKGGGGNDFIRGGAGADLLIGGNGDDSLLGGRGSDFLLGYRGDDVLTAWEGNDVLDGGPGVDRIYGGPDPDRCERGVLYRGCEEIVRRPAALPPGSYGLPEATRSYHAVKADFDSDGRLDVLVTHHASKKYYPEVPADTIYLNRDDAFVTEFVLPLADRHGCDAGDVDNDGLTDFFCQIGGRSGTDTDKVDELWIQEPWGSFTNRISASAISDPLGRGRFPALFDADGDGDLDVLLTNGPRVGGGSASVLWLNGGDRFERGRGWGLDGYVAPKPQVDAVDGWVLMADEGRARVFRRDGGRYLDVGGSIGASGWHAYQGVLTDFDGDGGLDAVIAHSRGISIRSLQPIRSTGPDVHISSAASAAVGDFDGDGEADVYVVRSGTGCLAADTARNREDVILWGPDLAARSSIPVSEGCGDMAVALDTDGDGNDEAFVLNGYQMARGPILIVDVG